MENQAWPCPHCMHMARAKDMPGMVGVSSSNTCGTCQAHAYRRSPPFMIVMTRQRSVLVWKAQASETMKRLCTRARIRFSTSAACTCQAHAKGTQLATVQPTAKDTPRTCRWHLPRIRGWCTPSTCQGDVPHAKHIWVAHAKHTQTVHSTLRTHMSLLAAGARLKRGGLKHAVHLHMPSACQARMKVRAKHKPSTRASPWAVDLLASLDGLKHLPHLCAPCTHQAHAKIRTGRDNREDAKGGGKEHRGQ